MVVRVFGLYVRWFVLPLYAVVCALLTFAGWQDEPEDLTGFVVVGLLLWSGYGVAAVLMWRGTRAPAGIRAWLSRVVAWILLAIIAVPFISGLIILGTLVVSAVPTLWPIRVSREQLA